MEPYFVNIDNLQLQFNLIGPVLQMHICGVGTFKNLKSELNNERLDPRILSAIRRAAEHFGVEV